MVKKLYKYELMSYLRTWIPTQIVVLIVALLGRIVQFFRNDSEAFETVMASTVIVYVLVLLAGAAITFFAAVNRFYRNMYTGEGYLTHTLPVSVAAHLWVKLSGAITMFLATVVMAFISLSVLTAGEYFVEILKAWAYCFDKAGIWFGNYTPLVFVTYLLDYLLWALEILLLFYACLSIGQLFRRGKLGVAVGLLIGYFILTRVATTIMTINGVLDNSLIGSSLLYLFDSSPLYYNADLAVELINLRFQSIIVSSVMSAVYVFVTGFILKKELNLE